MWMTQRGKGRGFFRTARCHVEWRAQPKISFIGQGCGSVEPDPGQQTLLSNQSKVLGLGFFKIRFTSHIYPKAMVLFHHLTK